MIEPGQLLPRIQFETERRVRHSKPTWFSRGRHEIIYDVVTVRSHHLAQKFQELKLRAVRAGRPRLDRLAQAFQERYGLRPLLVGKQERADKLLRELEAEGLADVTRGGREVAVIAVQAGAVAMLAESDSFTLPMRRGSGEEGCRDVLRASFGSADGQVRFRGLGGATGDRGTRFRPRAAAPLGASRGAPCWSRVPRLARPADPCGPDGRGSLGRVHRPVLRRAISARGDGASRSTV